MRAHVACWVGTLLLATDWSNVRADPPAKVPDPVELIGKAEEFYFNRNWNTYYWREDFSFVLKDEKSGVTWRIISREPTPAYDWRMGTTFCGLEVDWKSKPRVKVVGVTGVDRLPAEFYTFKLDEPRVATAFVVSIEVKEGEWKDYYVNNWFHPWGEKADPVIHRLYADRKAPYDIYGFIRGQTAPFSKKSREVIEKHPKAKMFHGMVRATKDNPFGFEIELLHLVGPDVQGNGVVFFGDDSMPRLDRKK